METNSYTPQEPSTPSVPTKVRNSFLTVICILTFIGSGWGLIKSVRTYVTADYISNVAEGAIQGAQNQMNEQGNTPGVVKSIMGSLAEDMTPEFLRELAILEFISNLLTLSGAILMWKLKKAGFYLYIAGIIILVAAPLAMGKLLGAIGATVVGFIGVVFIVMYGVNLKYMNKSGEV